MDAFRELANKYMMLTKSKRLDCTFSHSMELSAFVEGFTIMFDVSVSSVRHLPPRFDSFISK